MSTLDDDIREAFGALARQVPEDVFERLPERVEAKLATEASGDAMEGFDMHEGDGKPAVPPAPAVNGVGNKPGTTENTGLHDIKALARTTKQRISKRVSTQSDVEESLLTSSSSGLSAIALPEPGKDKQRFATEDGVAAATSTSAAAVSAAALAPEARPGTPRWIFAAAGVAVLGVVGFFVVRGQSKSEAVASAPAEPAAATPAEPPALPAPIVASAPEPAVAALGDDEDDGAHDQAADDDAAEPSATDPAPAAAVEREARAAAKAEPKAEPKNEPKASGDTSAARPASAERAAKTTTGKTAAQPDGAAKGANAAPAGAGAADGDRSIEALLAEATGDTGKSKAKDEATESAKPEKKDLSRADVTAGMRSVTGKVQACYAQHQERGQALVSLTIEPSGVVSSAKTTGQFAGTPTGECVAAAVKTATFPAWDGRAKSLSYPFLLSD